MGLPSDPELLRFIAREEALAQTLRAFPGLSEAQLRDVLERAATALTAASARVPKQGSLLDQVRERRDGSGASPAKPSSARGAGAASTSRAAPPEAAPAPAAATTGEVPTRVRVYSDGAARGNPGPAGAGAVIMDPAGRILVRLGKFLGTQTNNHAEYMGLIIGLERARELGATHVDVFADSELMIRQLGGRYQVKSATLKPLFERARKLLAGFEKTTLTHVLRAQNAAADEMSNRAIDERM